MNNIVTAKHTKVVHHSDGSTAVSFHNTEILKLDAGELTIRIPGYFSNALLCRLQQGMKMLGLNLSIRPGTDYLAIYHRTDKKEARRLGWPQSEVVKSYVMDVGAAV